uniref:Toxin BmKaIT1 n=2 Tax=Olivierus martensii TaxID=34649 RepID=SC12_OLIMR|nr:RecName: Full=Toxin BmKaIT1; Short=BmKalphaIT1; AltName: Full=Alpha-neurotoxin IT01; AltName: Full=Alpha-neurotoxin TX12; AltName: Full=BmKalphaIT01; AltName: Full=BmKalphaTx12; Flags: Precursor [Mesobuthus martensii]AAG39640.1 putative mammalian neurotoxin TX12 [Mesobuthus martensii]
MNYLVMISFAFLLMTGVESVRDAYIAQNYNCVYHCARDAYCNELCTKNGAKSGSCPYLGEHKFACYCKDLPDNVPIRVPGKCHRR